MLEKHGRRLTPDDPLFTNLRHPGEPIADMSQALGGIVKTAMTDLGINPENYSAHSLRKTRPSYAMSQNSSMTESMVHDGRSSEVTGIVYAHRNPRNPLDGDPTVDVYNKTSEIAAAKPEPLGRAAVATEPESVEPAGQDRQPTGATRDETAAGPAPSRRGHRHRKRRPNRGTPRRSRRPASVRRGRQNHCRDSENPPYDPHQPLPQCGQARGNPRSHPQRQTRPRHSEAPPQSASPGLTTAFGVFVTESSCYSGQQP